MRNARRVRVGMTQEQVESLLGGRPLRVIDLDEWMRQNPGLCISTTDYLRCWRSARWRGLTDF